MAGPFSKEPKDKPGFLPQLETPSFVPSCGFVHANVIKLQFAGSSSNNRLLANTGVGTTRPSVSLTVIRIQ